MRSGWVCSGVVVLAACAAFGPGCAAPSGASGGSSGGTDTAFQGVPSCPSGEYAQGGSDGTGDLMYPGRACLACHAADAGPLFAVGGTVFPSGKVLDDCLPPPSIDFTQAQVVIHDANGDHPIYVQTDGNFRSHAGQDNIAFPLTASVVYQGRARAMVSPQTSGDCNACHTAEGANGAPGRIALP